MLGPTSKGRWSYACSKAIDEFLALAYWRERKLPTVIVRLFNTVGPRQTGQYGMVVPTFVKQALTGRPITIHGDGRQSRCFADVSDVVRALVALMDHPAAVGEVFNIGIERGGDDPRAGRAGQGADELRLRDRLGPVRAGLRRGLRGHAPARARHQQDRRLIGYRPTKSLDQILQARDRVLPGCALISSSALRGLANGWVSRSSTGARPN